MLSGSVKRWAAWSPGLDGREAWEAWCRAPGPLAADGSPAVQFLPPLLRRRCSRLSKMVLEVAFACASREELSGVSTVFASRHGDTATNIVLLECLARGQPISPTRFSHSVHNAPAGLLSIAAGNCLASSSLAGARGTFAAGFLEALLLLHRHDGRPVMLIAADEPVPRPFDAFRDEPVAAYALALLLERGDDLGFRVARAGETPRRPEWPVALEFVRWLSTSEPALTVEGEGSRWTWVRSPET